MDLLNGLHCLVDGGGGGGDGDEVEGTMEWMGGLVSFCLRSSACSVYVYCSSVHRRVVGQVVLLCHCHGLFAWEKSPRHVPWSPTSESLADPRSPARAVRSAPGPNAPRLPRRGVSFTSDTCSFAGSGIGRGVQDCTWYHTYAQYIAPLTTPGPYR